MVTLPHVRAVQSRSRGRALWTALAIATALTADVIPAQSELRRMRDHFRNAARYGTSGPSAGCRAMIAVVRFGV